MRRLLLATLMVLASTIAFASPARAETIAGTFRYVDGGKPRPITAARVEIWRFAPGFLGIWSWGKVATVTTSDKGAISQYVPFVRRDVTYAVRVFATNDAAVVADGLGDFWVDPGIKRKVSRATDRLDVSFTFANRRHTQRFNAAETLRLAAAYARSHRGDSDMLPRVRVAPFATTFYNPVTDTIELTDQYWLDDLTLFHEYGHFLEEQLSSFAPIPTSHDGCRAELAFGILVNSPEHAWMEAFANYFAQVVARANPGYGLTGGSGTLPAWWMEKPSCSSLPASILGNAVEVRVAGVLWDLFDRPGDTTPPLSEAGDALERRDTEVFQILDRELDVAGVWPTISHFRNAWLARGLPGAELDAIFATNGVPTP